MHTGSLSPATCFRLNSGQPGDDSAFCGSIRWSCIQRMGHLRLLCWHGRGFACCWHQLGWCCFTRRQPQILAFCPAEILSNSPRARCAAVPGAASNTVVVVLSTGKALLQSICVAGMVFVSHCAAQCDDCLLIQDGKQDENGPQYDRLKALDSPVLRAGNWNQLCVTCKV